MKNFGPRNLVTVAVVTAFLVTGVVVGIGDDPEMVLANGCEAATPFEVGDGSSGSPFEISSVGHLRYLSSSTSAWPQGYHLKQTDDIPMTGCPMTPIGSNGSRFTGTYDGGGKAITGLTVTPGSLTHVGMFGYVEGATLHRIVLSGVSVSGGTDHLVGGLVGRSNISTISASSVTGVVTATGEESAVGGLVGRNSGGTIRGSSAHGEVNGESKAGGLVGRNQDGAEIVDSHATGNVTASDSQAGGLVGFNNSMILRSYATGNVTVSASVTDGNVGGLVGFHSDPGKIIDSYALGDVTGPRRVGGLVGFAFKGDISPEISNSYSVGAVTGSAPTGGLVGETDGGVTITASFWDVSTSGMTSSAGGVGVTTDVMTTFATYDQAGWEIVNKWQLPVAGGLVWGVCEEMNNGYPFLLWQFSGDQVPVPCGGTPQSPGGNDNGNGNGTVVLPEPTPVTTTPVTTLPSQPAPVAVGGVLPQNAPGEVTVFEDGQPVSVQVTVADAVQLVVRASTFELRLSGECSLRCPIISTPDGRQVLELQADGSARVEGEGFLPRSTVDVWLFSDPRYLGQLTADANGRFAGTVALGDIGVGEHTLQVNAVSPTGAQRSVNLGVVVTAPESSAAETLPSAGAEPLGLWMLAMALLGLGLILSVRRRPIPS